MKLHGFRKYLLPGIDWIELETDFHHRVCCLVKREYLRWGSEVKFNRLENFSYIQAMEVVTQYFIHRLNADSFDKFSALVTMLVDILKSYVGRICRDIRRHINVVVGRGV